MTPGAPTDGARSRFPGHRGSTEAGTTLKDSGKRRRSSKGVHCGSPLIDEAGARWVEPVHPLGSKSHLVASLANAEAIGVVAPDVEAVEAGQELAVVPFVG